MLTSLAYRERGGETYLLAERIGQQESGTWVFKERQFSSTGESTNEEKSHIVFNPNLGRLIAIAVFSSTDGDSQAWDELVEAQKGASGALPQLLALGYPAAQVRQLSKELRSHLPHAHVRVADSIALVLWYAMAVCRLSGFDEERIKHYALANLCKLANDADSASDSLTDFLDKLSALHAQSLVGEWDCRVVKTREGFEALALNLPSVWGKVERVYNPPYSRRVIESQIAASGGVLKSVQKFYRSEDEVKAYRRALVTGGNQGDNYLPPSPYVEKVTSSDELGENLDRTRDTVSYFAPSNRALASTTNQVTESISPKEKLDKIQSMPSPVISNPVD